MQVHGQKLFLESLLGGGGWGGGGESEIQTNSFTYIEVQAMSLIQEVAIYESSQVIRL